MKNKTKFIKIYNMLSDEAKMNLIYKPYSDNPMTLSVLCLEIKNDTKLGKKILKEMFKDKRQTV